jgi:hypothetical protein
VTLTAAPPHPPGEAPRLQRLAAPLLTGGLAGLGALALRVRDPHDGGSWGFCPIALLGLACPACGSLRAVNDLTHLDLGAAASSNLLLVLVLPVALALWGRSLVALWRGGPAAAPLVVPGAVWVAVGVLVAAFTLARNLPLGAWLAP